MYLLIINHLRETSALNQKGCIVVKTRQDEQVINKAIYLALGVNTEGHKELLDM